MARELDTSTLEPFPSEHVSDSLQARVGDLVWRLRLRSGRPVYLLLEFQSTPDRAMALRMLVYVGLFSQGLIRRGESEGRARLPPILPVVLYNGKRPWRAAGQVSELFSAGGRELAKYGPRQRYLLLDVERLPDPDADGATNLAALLFRLERSRTAEETLAGLEALRRGLDRAASPELQRAFTTWLRRASRVRGAFEMLVEEEETMFEQAIAQLKEHLRAQGRLEGEARILLRQLAFKFGPLDAAVREKVASASPGQIALWAERLLIAPSLAEVFATPS